MGTGKKPGKGSRGIFLQILARHGVELSGAGQVGKVLEGHLSRDLLASPRD